MKHEENGDYETTRSGLFFEAIRVIKEMRDADIRRGRTGLDVRCRFGLLENVNGILSSNNGEDFRTVLESLARISEDGVHVPKPEKYERGGGATQELLSEMRSLSLGESRTRSIGAYPSGGSASLFSPISMDYLPRRSCLSAILEENPDPKYDLSPKACLGILRRAVRRGKIEKMPEILVKALEYQAGVTLSEIISMAESSEKTPSASTLVGGVTGNPCSSGSESDAVYGFPLGFRPENVKCYEETATTLCNGTRPGFTTGIVIVTGEKNDKQK